jgi:hypothetical protein
MLSLALNIVLATAGFNHSLAPLSFEGQEIVADQVQLKPSTNVPVAKVLRDAQVTFQAPRIITRDPAADGNDRLVTLRLEQVPARDFLDRLIREFDANVIYSARDIPETTITINVHDISLGAVLSATGSMLGGYWTSRDGVAVFHKGEAPKRAGASMDYNVFQDYSPSRNTGFTFTPQIQGSTTSTNQTGTVFTSPFPFKEPAPHVSGQTPTITVKPPVNLNYRIQLDDSAKPQTTTRVFTSRPNIVWTAPRHMLTFTSGSSGLPTLVKSLSAAQKKTLAKRGYLKTSELTSYQKSLLGNVKGLKELKYSGAGGSITVKG